MMQRPRRWKLRRRSRPPSTTAKSRRTATASRTPALAEFCADCSRLTPDRRITRTARCGLRRRGPTSVRAHQNNTQNRAVKRRPIARASCRLLGRKKLSGRPPSQVLAGGGRKAEGRQVSSGRLLALALFDRGVLRGPCACEVSCARDLGPARAPRLGAGIPPDAAIAEFEFYDGEIGACRSAGGETERQYANRKCKRFIVSSLLCLPGKFSIVRART